MMLCRMYRAALVAAAFTFATIATAAKAPHDPTQEITTTTLVSPFFQDLSQSFTFNSIIFEDFTPIYTTLTVSLVQDYRGTLSGQAIFRTSKTSQQQTFPLTGKMKIKKATKKNPLPTMTFTTRGKSQTSATITIAASAPVQPVVESHSEDSFDKQRTTTYQVDVKIRGTGRAYTYSEQVPIVGDNFIQFFKASHEATNGLKPKKGSDYYQLITPYGMALADGTTQIYTVEGVGEVCTFTLRATKFLGVFTDNDFDGSNFEPDTCTVKQGYGKFTADIVPADEPVVEETWFTFE